MHNRFVFTDLCILEWNLNGLFTNLNGHCYCKLQSPYFWEAIKGPTYLDVSQPTYLDVSQVQGFGTKIECCEPTC